MRYFIITYSHGRGGLGFGLITRSQKEYPNYYELIEKMEESCQNPSILNIMEVDEKDFDSFSKEI